MPASDAASSDANMFSPPINRSMVTLERDFFKSKISLAAARINEHNQIAKCRSFLGRDVLKQPSINSVVIDPSERESPDPRKMILLRPSIQPNGKLTSDDLSFRF